MSDLPTGTVTFLFSDIEGSTRLIQQLGDRYPEALLAHNRLLRAAFAADGGHELRTEGDSFFIVFSSALKACAGAAAAQRDLARYAWPEGGRVRVRIGLHTGEATLVGNEYLGLDVHRAARVASVAHGGQVLLSETTRSLVDGSLPTGLTLRDLGAHRLKDLARPERLFQLTIDGLDADFPALRSLESTPNNLPLQMTSFIGRDDQVREAKELLSRARLLTLTGPGGTGKTRLSLQIAAEVLDRFPDGVYFVPLAAVQDPQLVPSAIAQAITIPVSGNKRPMDGLLDHLKERELLLVLDNFEQLLAAGPIIAELLQSSPRLRVLVSSRANLRIYGEQEFQVPPLQLPDLKALPGLAALSQYEAVKLFIERALAVNPGFAVDNENAPAIAGIVERLDGLPLAIELAAARIKLFSPQALLARLEKSPSALGTGSRDLPSRQQTLRGTIAWSYNLLDAPRQRLLARFSVFARSGSLEQLEPVCGPPDETGGEVVDGLDELANQSLLRRLPQFDEPRFLMLQTIREFALERLAESGESDAIRERHARTFAELAEKAHPLLFGPEQKEWLDRLERDHDNFRAALDWSIARGDAQMAMRLGGAFWRFWQMRGHIHEGRARLAEALALPSSKNFPVERAHALEAAGGLAYWQNDTDAAQQLYDECLELTRHSGDKRALATAIYNDAFPKAMSGKDVTRATAQFDEALKLFRELGDDAGVARALWGVGLGHYYAERSEGALAPFREAEALDRRLNLRFDLGWSLHMLGIVNMNLKRVPEAKPYLTEALGIFDQSKDVTGIVFGIDNLAEVARREGDVLRAVRLAGAAAAHGASTGTGLLEHVHEHEGRTGYKELTEEGERAWAEGQAMSLDQAVRYALDSAASDASPLKRPAIQGDHMDDG